MIYLLHKSEDTLVKILKYNEQGTFGLFGIDVDDFASLMVYLVPRTMVYHII